jgi:hypothetical protein
VRPILDEKRDDSGQAPVGASRHPLPWRNRPSGGENHISDADGRVVYDGSDAAEMFRLYAEEVRAERADRPAAEPGGDGPHRRGRDRRARRAT